MFPFSFEGLHFMSKLYYVDCVRLHTGHDMEISPNKKKKPP